MISLFADREVTNKLRRKFVAELVDILGYLFMRATGAVVCRLPRRVVFFLRWFGDFVYYFIPVRRMQVIDSLKKAYPELPFAKINDMAREIYMNTFLSFLEFMRFPVMKKEDFKKQVRFEGLVHFADALSHGRGAILLTAHIGNWEMLGAALSHAGYPLVSMARVQSGRVDGFVNFLRRLSGNEVVDRNKSALKIMRALKANRIIGMLADQHSDNAGVKVKFFGRDCMATSAPVLFAMKSGAPVIPTFIYREGMNHRVVIEPPLKLEKTSDGQKDIERNTQLITDCIERAIRRWPEGWFWFHRRWRE